MKKIIVLLLIVFCGFHVFSQTFVGKHKSEIRKEMRNYQDFAFTKEILGKKSYIKYEDIDRCRTLLFVLNSEGNCKYQMLMCDYSLLKQMIQMLNDTYEYQNNFIWKDTKQNYVIKIKKDDWYFSVITRKSEKKD
ncbi:MAG: hypothetical protein MI739_00630 [Bacteroidales bacterium]|nr:hypothetical protein [Bacteroidales bacterium]